MTKVLLIDDDERLAVLLAEYFSQHNIELESATRPGIAFEKLESGQQYDLIILDIMLPEMDGFEVCKKIRHSSDIPILMLTARGDVMDRVIGLEIGADDYLAKPFEPRELVARINNILKRRPAEPSTGIFRFGMLSVDTELRQAIVDNRQLDLSASEYQLLELFIQHKGKTISRDEIISHLRGREVEIYSRSVDILISRLRHKLQPFDGIKTVRGRGYCFAGREQK